VSLHVSTTAEVEIRLRQDETSMGSRCQVQIGDLERFVASVRAQGGSTTTEVSIGDGTPTSLYCRVKRQLAPPEPEEEPDAHHD